jgi:hypothetical protein
VNLAEASSSAVEDLGRDLERVFGHAQHIRHRLVARIDLSSALPPEEELARLGPLLNQLRPLVGHVQLVCPDSVARSRALLEAVATGQVLGLKGPRGADSARCVAKRQS